MSEAETPSILVLARDLMFSARIAAEARAAAVTIQIIRDYGQMPLFAAAAARTLLVDLNLPGAIEAAARWRQAGARTAVGFVSHVDAATIAQAKNAGIDQVLPRSQFVRILPDLIRGTPAK
jgi:hypothetical protein